MLGRTGLLLAMLPGLQMAPAQAADENTTPVSAAAQPAVIYKPPLRGAPQTRVGGGTRGQGSDIVLQVLAPDHAGLTTRAQPTLYWYARTPVPARFEAALIDAQGMDPLLEVEAGTGKAAGIQQLDLGDHGFFLQPGVPYQVLGAAAGIRHQRHGPGRQRCYREDRAGRGPGQPYRQQCRHAAGTGFCQ
jgi:hypothetical protein